MRRSTNKRTRAHELRCSLVQNSDLRFTPDHGFSDPPSRGFQRDGNSPIFSSSIIDTSSDILLKHAGRRNGRAVAVQLHPVLSACKCCPRGLGHSSSWTELTLLQVGVCWGFTTPFIRKAAVNYSPPTHPSISDPNRSWIARQIAKAFFTVIGLIRKPTYAIPLVANLTGSIWFFLLVGQAGSSTSIRPSSQLMLAELSLTVPITNSLAFLFTVLGEYLAEGKLITRDTWIGMVCVCAGIGLCVYSKL